MNGTPVRVHPSDLVLSEGRGSRPTPVRVDTTREGRRFWSRVDQNGPVNQRRPELGPCWIWTGSCYTDPRNGQPAYGQTSYLGKRMGAHKASFLMHGGTIPPGFDVMHACDTKPCVRPEHLSAGTRSENLLDGFQAPANAGVCAGENNGRARLRWDDIHAIRATPKVWGYQPVLAERYGVTQAQISQILSGRRWPESKCPMHSVDVAASRHQPPEVSSSVRAPQESPTTPPVAGPQRSGNR